MLTTPAEPKRKKADLMTQAGLSTFHSDFCIQRSVFTTVVPSGGRR
jgi:hypothetical protein